MLHGILQTREMIKKSMKAGKGAMSAARLRLMDARQFALKMVANVTYGYTSASFSGRMPCVELADAIVDTGKRTLEASMRVAEGTVRLMGHPAAGLPPSRPSPASPGAPSGSSWLPARVVYGDTDSMFVVLPGADLQSSFDRANALASAVNERCPEPVRLKMEKIYWPGVLASKKRYAGWCWEHPPPLQKAPFLEIKGLEAIRRD